MDTVTISRSDFELLADLYRQAIDMLRSADIMWPSSKLQADYLQTMMNGALAGEDVLERIEAEIQRVDLLSLAAPASYTQCVTVFHEAESN